MIKLIKNDISICLNSKKYQITALCLCAWLAYNLVVYLISLYGKSSLEIKTTIEMGLILSFGYMKSIYISIILIIPLLSGIYYSDTIILESKKNICQYFYTRCNKLKYYTSKAFSIFIINFCTTFFTIISIEILCWIAVPNIGLDDIVPIYEQTHGTINIFWPEFYIASPYLYSIFIILNLAIYSAFIGVFALSLSMIYPKMKSSYLCAITFLLINVIEIVLPRDLVYSMYLQCSPQAVRKYVIMLISWGCFVCVTYILGIQNVSKS